MKHLLKQISRSAALVEGVVVDTNDPQQMGRVKAWCPSVDGENKDPIYLPWVTYVSQLAGQTLDYPAGSSGAVTSGYHSYGFWAVPKKGATIIVGFLHGDTNRRFYLGSYFPDHGNRSLPVGRNTITAPISDTNERIEPQLSNLNDQFQGNLTAPQARTRGAYERAAAQPKTQKDGSEGYQKSVFDSDLDPQTYCLTTPGRHAIIMQDNPSTGRMRLKTADGHQIIFDDANERIYVSTCKGKTWLELDADGHVHLYGAESVSVTAGEDVNFTAARDFNVKAGRNINLSASGWFRASACSDVSLSGDAKVSITSGGPMDLLAAANITQTGSSIHLNGPQAAAAECAEAPSVVPDHEPWKRPAAKKARGKNWKE